MILVGYMDGDWHDELFSEARQEMQKVDFWKHPSPKSKPAHHKWTRWPPHHHQLSAYGHVEGWSYGLAWYWLEIWMETGMINCSQKPDKKCKKLIFDNIPELQIQPKPNTSQMDQMTSSPPPIMIVWTCCRMMVWTSRILVGNMDGDWQDLFSTARKEMQTVDFWQHPRTSNPTQHITNGPDDLLTATKHHHMDMLKDDGID
jgi:hypothetical protein